MLSYQTLALVALTTLAAASPIAKPNASSSSSSNQLPNPILSLWDSTIDSVVSSPATGLIQRSAGYDEVSTLFTFSVPSQYSSNTCALTFSLSASTSGIDGVNTKMQLFRTSRAATAGATSDFRDSEIATVQAVAGGLGVWGTVDGRSTGQTSLQVPCSQLISYPNLELAPVGDDVAVYFGVSDGLQISVLA